MNRNDILTDIKNTLGTVPEFLSSIPDDTLQSEWDVFKKYGVLETSIPQKYRELIGVAVASVLHCWYCSKFHKASAELYGATEKEINEAVYLAKHTIGWSTYLNGKVYDKDKFLQELQTIGEYVAEQTTG
jgi:AhpD family alkylhydroperoxidase